MRITRFWALIGVTALLCGDMTSTAAADAACPSTDRLQFLKSSGSGPSVANATTFATAAHVLQMGSFNIGPGFVDVAVIRNVSTGTCGYYYFSYDGSTPIVSLTKNTNLCMGDYDDNIITDSGSGSIITDCTGAEYTAMQPLLYNGFRLNTYGGYGHDHVHGGLGRDYVYGNQSGDNLWDAGGSGDRVYGESGIDDNQCSWGSSTLCDGGSNNDTMEDLSGSGDAIYGGASSDDIWACGNASTIDCGSGTSDDVMTHGGTLIGCENQTIAPWCL